VAKPLTNVAINRSGLGAEIVQESFFDTNQLRAYQGAPLTAEAYKDMAKWLANLEVRVMSTQLADLGINLAPEEVREIVRGFALGPFRAALQVAIENPQKAAMGRPTEPPIVRSFVSGYNSNALITEMGRFTTEGRDLLRERNASLEPNASPESFAPNERELRVLALYEGWVEEEKALRNEARAMTLAGVDRGINPARMAQREKREEAQARFVREFNALER
jgi:hypothetical protein